MRKKKNNKEIFGITAGQPTAPDGVLDADKVLGKYVEVFYLQNKQKNGLLGEFDSKGKYSITDEKTLQELVNIPKKFEEKVDNVVYTSAKLDGFVLNFKVSFDIAESYCNATLEFIEIEQGLEEDIKHITSLGTMIEPYSPKFKEEVYKEWNIYFDDDNHDKNDYLKNCLLKQQQELEFSRELVEILAQLYLVRMLKLLEGSGELGEKILLQYKQIVEKLLQQDPSLSQDNTRLKFILDKVILKNKAFDKIMAQPDAAKIMAGFSAPILRLKEKSPAVISAPNSSKKDDKTQEKKDEKKASKPAKAKGKAKAKAGSVKAAKLDWSKLPKVASGAPKGVVISSTTVTKPAKAEETKSSEPKKEKSKTEPTLEDMQAMLDKQARETENQVKKAEDWANLFFDSKDNELGKEDTTEELGNGKSTEELGGAQTKRNLENEDYSERIL